MRTALSRFLLLAVLFSGAPGFLAAADSPAPPEEPEGEHTSRNVDSIAIIDGNNGSGTGFLTEMRGSLFVVTNLHVLSGNDTFTVKTLSGKRLAPAGMFGAVGQDVAILRIRDDSAQPDGLDYQPDIHQFVNAGDEILVLGNSQGRGTVLETPGKVLGIGPEKLEIDNPIYPGNSGSPILHKPTGRVIGVVSYAEKISERDFVSEASRKDDRSAVKSDVRYFGYRLDSVESWERIDWNRFRTEGKQLQSFHRDSLALVSFFFDDEGGHEENPRLKRAFDEYQRRTSGTSAANVERVKAANHFIRQLDNFMREGVSTLEQQKDRFYDHHRIRAREELELRENLAKALDEFRTDFRILTRRIIR